MDGGRREAEHEKVDHKESSDDEEVELLSHGKGAGGTDLRGGGDIRVRHSSGRVVVEDGAS